MASHLHILKYIASFVDQATMYLAWSPAQNQKVPCDSSFTHTPCVSLSLSLYLSYVLCVYMPDDLYAQKLDIGHIYIYI